ncbi:hydroxylamine reductase [Methanocella paludicola SANAE]|uniref:Hydroxylamine reductase n=1 Tax=Methanocella paludicola (strain DSM 17711 / JCM 13418 / NBRC 101707 / SANAE) TaxID=304371 RepID=D1Z2A4_METPS|nr:hydroxylamine reductase [Methanocella paludicola SANAE]
MFCYQCEQTANGKGCTKMGVCGKTADVAALQDLMIYAVRGLSEVAVEARKAGVVDPEVNRFTVNALFSTLTNVDFDPARFQVLIGRCVELREQLRNKAKLGTFDGAAAFQPAKDPNGLVDQGTKVGLMSDTFSADENIRSLQHTTLYGIKGVAAYADHAQILGQEDDRVYAYIHEALTAMGNKSLGLNDWVGLTLKCGEINIRTMELLDAGNTGTYGHPVPTAVPLGAKKGKAILVSGHDLKDLEELLKQTEGKDIYVYTHGEMLPTHGYPGLKKYKHFYGHYGTAWQNQAKEFAAFPGPIVMTTNCIQKPRESYQNSIYTMGPVGWPGVVHLKDRDFSPVIKKALEMPGFTEDKEGGSVMVGFGRNAVLGVAPAVIDAVKAGKIRHFFLVGGCDGAKASRNYYTEFVEKVPKDCVVLTLACGKFKFFDKELGNIGGIPRLLDVGQCNDAYSAVKIAMALADAFKIGVNDLPLSMILSWYEQKAAAILLSLLYLGIKDIRLGPSLPAFITPAVLDVLVKNFNIMPITTPDQDLKAILG